MGQQTIKMGDLVENIFRGINANFTDIELTKSTKEELAQMQAAVFTFICDSLDRRFNTDYLPLCFLLR